MADNVQLAAMTGGDVCAADEIGGIKHQRMKVEFGADGSATDVDATHPMPVQVGDAAAQANAIGGDTGQNALVAAGARKEVAFTTTTAQAVASTDVSNYRWVSVHIVTQGTSSTVAFQCSNDGTNWVAANLITSTSTAGPVVASTTAAGALLHGPLPYRYFRLNVTGISAGTTAGVVEFFAVPAAMQGTGVDTELPAAAALADATANPSTPTVGADNLVFNGTTWDRVRNVTAVDGAGSTGLMAAGLVGYDAVTAVNRRAQVDANGNQLIAGGFKELTGSASANNTDLIAATDVSQYRWLSFQSTSAATCTITVQGSNDGTNWFGVGLSRIDANQVATPVASTITNPTATNCVAGPINFRYLRVRLTTYTSGTASGVLELFAQPSQLVWSNITTIGSITNGVPVNVASNTGPGDAQTQVIGVVGTFVWNGTTWDRQRGANGAANTTGTGLSGAGILGFDGTNYQRSKCDTSGNLLTHRAQAAAAALSSVTSSASTGTLLTANTARRGAIVVNESTATLYIAYAATASLTAYTAAVPPSYTWEMPEPVYAGLLSAIWSAANGAARVTELS